MFMIRCCGLIILLLASSGWAAEAQQNSDIVKQEQSPEFKQKDAGKNAEAKRSAEKLRAMDLEYNRAMELSDQHREFDALPIWEHLIKRYPDDPMTMRHLGIALIATNPTIPDEKARKEQRARGWSLLSRFKSLGYQDELATYYLSVIPEDGGLDAMFSNRKEVNDAMKEGEEAFARHDYKSAIAAYTRAMEADPSLYHAVLFIGDSYFAEGDYDNAILWFERAGRVNPNIETAYRYWGDALLKTGKMADARARYIDAIIADPYNRRTWSGIQSWIDKNKVRAVMPDIKAPKRPVNADNGGKIQIMIDPNTLNDQAKQNGTSAWMMYSLIIGSWQAKNFKEKFPNEKEYRHSLLEESDALGLVAATVNADIAKGNLKPEALDPGIATLLKLHKAGLMDPYILFTMVDKGIAQDYAGYRGIYRDKLRQFLDEFVIPKSPQ
jgi:tetratricopeptide (TPR) repeat protein